jgi:glycerol-3-phosphate O-acyltransferase
MSNQKKHPISSIVLKIRQWISRLLKNSHDHFFCFLPSPTGALSGVFLSRLFSGVFMGGEQSDIIKNIPNDAIIVYTTKYKSRFEFLFSHTRYRELRLPVPQLAFDSDIYFWQPVSRILRICLAYLDELVQRRRILDPYRDDFYQRALVSSGAAVLTLVEKKGFYRRFVKDRPDPLVYLIKMQKKIDRPIYLVPQLMFFGKKPLPAVPSLLDTFFGTSQRPGKLRKNCHLVPLSGQNFR